MQACQTLCCRMRLSTVNNSVCFRADAACPAVRSRALAYRACVCVCVYDALCTRTCGGRACAAGMIWNATRGVLSSCARAAAPDDRGPVPVSPGGAPIPLNPSCCDCSSSTMITAYLSPNNSAVCTQ